MPLAVWRRLVAVPETLRASVAPSVWGAGARWPQLVVAYLPGDEYSVDVLCDRGETVEAVARLRTAAVGGLAVTAEVVDAPDVVAAAREIVRAIGLSHVVNVQFRRDAAGAPRLLEINPRTPGTIGLTVAAGFNLPLAAFARALGGDLALPAAPDYGLFCFRYHGMVLSDGRRL
jgi:carbamoyl-phosphate synthase large subunit